MQKLFAPSLGLAVAGLLPAQLPPGTPTAEPFGHVLNWPATIGAGSAFGRVVGAHLDSTELLSAAVQKGGSVAQAAGPAFFEAIEQLAIGGPVVDVVTLPRAGVADRDALLLTTTGPSDLLVAWFDAQGALQVLPVSQPGWAQATLLCAVPDTLGIDVVGRAAGSNAVLRTRYDFATGSFTAGVTVQAASTPRDLALLDFDDDGHNDVAVLGNTHLQVFDRWSGLLLSVPLSHQGGAIEVVADPVERDALALLYRRPDNLGWLLQHITNQSQETPVPIAIDGADFTLVGMASGDVNADGDMDLVIQKTGRKILLVPNSGSGPQHFGAGMTTLELTNVAGNQGAASVRDYDRDGAADILAPLTGPGGASYLVLRVGLPSSINSEAPTYSDIFYDVSLFDAPVLNLRLVLDSSFATFNQIRLVGWSGPHDGEVNPNAAFHYVYSYSYPSLGPAFYQLTVPNCGANIQHPNLLYLLLEFSDAGNPNPDHMVTYILGATSRESAGENPPGMATLEANASPGATKKKLQKSGGRVFIGGSIQQEDIPLKTKGNRGTAVTGTIGTFEGG